jgi:hypothetical protein
MNPGIFLIQDNEELVEMNEQPYNSEKLLQTWLAKYPALLVGNQMNAKEPRRFLLIEQECGVPAKVQGSDRWKIDHLFLDQDPVDLDPDEFGRLAENNLKERRLRLLFVAR